MFEVKIEVTVGLSKGLTRIAERILDALEPAGLDRLNRALGENERATDELRDTVTEAGK
jgi:hypothetical protein